METLKNYSSLRLVKPTEVPDMASLPLILLYARLPNT
jgi:hypothetical protein